MDKIGHWHSMIESYEEELRAINLKLEEANASKASVSEFHRNISIFWGAESQRILGHVVYAPPISVDTGNSRFTEDWALIELNRGKFDRNTFQGNVIHLGSELTSHQFMKKMYPHDETRAKSKYPRGGLMQLQDFVKYDELRCPTMLDANGEECLIVVKNGATTGVRLGRATGIESFVREYKDSAIHSTSMEIAVYPYSNKDGAFSAPGDSGSVVGDANSRIVGMLTGGAGQTDSTDVTYVSAYESLDERIKKAFPHSHLFPIRNPTPA